MASGIVKWFNSTKGYGFIKPDDSDQDVFVHITAVKDAGWETLEEDQRVNYELSEGRNGKSSATMRSNSRLKSDSICR